jgi:hypothetical protein
MKNFIACILVSMCFIGFNSARAAEQECSDEVASAAKSSARDLKNWESVYIFFKQYQDCADTSIVESATHSIQNLWVNHWPEIQKMVYYTNRDPAFKDFIWNKIGDDSFVLEDFDLFVENAKEECPLNALNFCRAVVKEAYKYLLVKPVIKQDRS